MKVAPALAASSAWLAEKQRVTFVWWPSEVSALEAFKPSRVSGSLMQWGIIDRPLVLLDNKNHAVFSAAQAAQARALKALGFRRYFLNNGRYLLPSLLFLVNIIAHRPVAALSPVAM